MLKLELVRFHYTPLITCGVIHTRDGWTCVTGEGVVMETTHPPRGKAALVEGLYGLRYCSDGVMAGSVEIYDGNSAPPVSRFSLLPRAILAQGNIIIGYAVDLSSGTIGETAMAYADLVFKVKEAKEACLSIRHLDNTQLVHFERMVREVKQ